MDITQAAQAGYRGEGQRFIPSSALWCAYVAGMTHRVRGGKFPDTARMGRGYRVHVASRQYDAYGPECQESRLVVARPSPMLTESEA